MKNKICQDALSSRHSQNMNENLKREVMNLTTTMQIATRENDDLKKETAMLKDTLNNKD